MCPSSQYPVLKVHAVRLIRSDRAARQGDILPDPRGAGGGNRALHILFTNGLRGPGNNKGRMGGHKSQTDRMTSAILLSDVEVVTLYPNKQEQHAIEHKNRFFIPTTLHSNGALSDNDRAPLQHKSESNTAKTR